MRIFFVIAIILFGSISVFADDPGERDSIIVETVFAELGDSIVNVRIFATTDDSVSWYNLPITWNSYNNSSIYPIDVSYYNVLPGWRDLEDIVFFDQLLLRMLGFSSDHFDNRLFTNNIRAHCWTIHFKVDSMTIPQIVSIDTTYDSYGGSLLFGLNGGVITFIPVFIPGAIYYGVTSDNSENEQALPAQIALSQNYPNPFNAQTTIEFALPEEAEVGLVVYDLLGRKVATLIEGVKPAGVHSITFDASDLPSGVYFYRLQAGRVVETKRMVLLK